MTDHHICLVDKVDFANKPTHFHTVNAEGNKAIKRLKEGSTLILFKAKKPYLVEP